MRIVLDTNVVVSGLLWPGPPGRLLDLLRSGQASAFTSEALLAELADVLSRGHLAPILARHQASAAVLVHGYALLAATVPAAAIAAVVAADPDDDAVLACALAAAAEIIVSGDAHLRNLKSWQRIPILAPAQALVKIQTRP
ncbi:MAG: putative toxin-antitoxin system toxin component, PIN family [Burkholderiales bacterium]|nr:putative toxin-antitoxin system toxin component, PIN family [Burkholderiales bacterium]